MGEGEGQQALANVILSKPGLTNKIQQSKRTFFLGKLAAQQAEMSGNSETSRNDWKTIHEPSKVSTPLSAIPATAQATKKRSRRRGGGGGAAAQTEAEARDKLEALFAACRRRDPVRITRTMELVQGLARLASIPPSLLTEA